MGERRPVGRGHAGQDDDQGSDGGRDLAQDNQKDDGDDRREEELAHGDLR